MMDREAAEAAIQHSLGMFRNVELFRDDDWVNIVGGREGVRTYLVAGGTLGGDMDAELRELDGLLQDHAADAWSALVRSGRDLSDPDACWQHLRPSGEADAEEGP